MARTKQTARKSCGGKAPRKMMAAKSARQLRQFLTSRQTATYASAGPSEQQKTSYLNYENMFYSYSFFTGAPSARPFEPRFTSGGCANPTTGEREHWVGMSFNSMYDGPGIKTHGRPHLNLAIVLDISGSMGIAFDQDSHVGGASPNKLTVAKQCLQTLTDQLRPSDQFGLVRFNQLAEVHCPMKPWRTVNKAQLKREIGTLRPYGATCLSAAIDCATQLFSAAGEGAHASSRVIFLTDLCSTVDSTNDEKKLLEAIRSNADRGIYTTVVGIGMDLNVRLVEEISKTRGAKYCSVDGAEEFKRIMNQEFDYDVTILAFNIRIEVRTSEYHFAKGYGSPELNHLQPRKPVVISSEFPSWQDSQGQSKGGMLLYRVGHKESKKTPTKEIKIRVTWEDLSGVDHSEIHILKLNDTFTDSGTRKAALLVHYVDLHNDYVHDRRRNKTKFLELFQSFRSHFVQELEEMKDKTLATSNRGDLELLDKIIELESKPEGSTAAGPSTQPGALSTPPPPVRRRVRLPASARRTGPPKRLQRAQRRSAPTALKTGPKAKGLAPQTSATPLRRSSRLASQSPGGQNSDHRKRKGESQQDTPAKRRPTEITPSPKPAKMRRGAQRKK